jgi:hypothetical protein
MRSRQPPQAANGTRGGGSVGQVEGVAHRGVDLGEQVSVTADPRKVFRKTLCSGQSGTRTLVEHRSSADKDS